MNLPPTLDHFLLEGSRFIGRLAGRDCRPPDEAPQALGSRSRCASHFPRASSRLRNQLAFKHSARNLPLRLSMKALSVGLPGREKSSVTPRIKAHRSSSLLINSGPLSSRIVL